MNHEITDRDPRPYSGRRRRSGIWLAAACVWLGGWHVSSAQAQQRTITPNYRDAEISQIIEAVSEITGKTFIIDPRARAANVTMLSQTPMTPEAFYQAFLSILQVHGLAAVPAGNVIKIIPDQESRIRPGNDLPERVSASSDEIVTQVITLKNANASQLSTILRPLIPPQALISPYIPSNSLIITDRANNVNRIMRVINRLDQIADEDVDVIHLEHAVAADAVRVVNQLYPGGAADGGPGVKVVADDRTNSIIISGDVNRRMRVKALITYLDTPVENGSGTETRYLRYADAEKIAAILREQLPATAAAVGGAAPGQPGAPTATQLARDVTILAEPETNALIITAPPQIMRSLLDVIAKLDIRRAQVLVEAIVVDVSINKAAELGVNWAAFSEEDDTRIPAGGFISPVGGVSLIDLVRAVDDPSTAPPGLNNGTTIGIGRIAPDGISFAAMLRALRSDDNSNIIGMPQMVTMDNQEAEIQVVREVPFITGQFTNTGTNGALNPFQTIQRQEVGTILKVTPQINEGDAVMLKIELESSDVLPASAVQNAVDVVTSKRTINTNVLIEDGGIVVLGGLISENFTRQETRVPYLGRIPVLGNLFKTRSGQNNRTNLMVFIRPKILRDGVQTAIETNAKYNYIRGEQQKVGRRELLPVLPDVKNPTLPPLDEEQVRAAQPRPPEPEDEEEVLKTEPVPRKDDLEPGSEAPPTPRP